MIGYSAVGFNLVEVAPEFALVINKTSQLITEDISILQERFDELIQQLQIQQTQNEPDELLIAKKGIRHLLDGLNSDKKKTKKISFTLAYNEFSKLITLENNITSNKVTDDLTFRDLTCIGYWGNYHYFSLLNDKKSAAIQVYECATKYPNHAVDMFSNSFFGKDYSQLFETIENDIGNAKDRLSRFQSLKESMEYLAISASMIAGGWLEQDFIFLDNEISTLTTMIENMENLRMSYLQEIVKGSLECLSKLKSVNLETLIESK